MIFITLLWLIFKDDVITEYDGREVNDIAALKNMVAHTVPGKEVLVDYLREGSAKTIKVAIQELPAQMQLSSKYEKRLKGLSVQNITPDMRNNLDIPNRVRGVIVVDVDEESASAEVLTKGDVIVEVNRERINNVKDYEEIVSKISADQGVLLLVYRNGSMLYVTM